MIDFKKSFERKARQKLGECREGEQITLERKQR